MEKKLSEELRHCLDGGGCGKCDCYEAKSVLTCRKLLQAAYGRIKGYEDLEEQGKLIVLPCAVGDTVYWVNDWFYEGKIGLNHKSHITESEVSRFFYVELGLFIRLRNGENISISEFGRTVFLTKEQAEAALKETEGKE